MGSNVVHSRVSFLPGSTVEFDLRTADSGRTVDTADHRSACLITLDGNSCCDSEIIDIQIKRAMVLSVKREESLLQQKYHKMDLTALDEEEIFSDSHYSEVLDPPVSVHTEEGVTNGQFDTGPWHQIQRRLWQSHVHYLHTGRDNIIACL